MKYNINDWHDINQAIEREYFITDGYGGFASSTIVGVNTRRYHGLDHRALNHPVDRHIFISKLHEVLRFRDEEFILNPDFDRTLDIRDLEALQRVSVKETIKYDYKVPNENIFIEKEMIKGRKEGYVAIKYNITNKANQTAKLEIYPYIVDRDHHDLRKDTNIDMQKRYIKNGVCYQFSKGKCYIQMEKSEFEEENKWTKWLYYPTEESRGLDFKEKAFISDKINLSIERNTKISAVIYLRAKLDEDSFEDTKKYLESRMDKIVEKAGVKTKFENDLIKAADKFIVNRESTKAKSIIAGYPWFTDWGRDTMISFSGLLLATKRWDDARSVLLSFSEYIEGGLIPNMFPDSDQNPLYNTCDASLWYFIACYKYYEKTNDISFIKKLYPKLESIIRGHFEGAKGPIYRAQNGLIWSGSKDTQLTWMDVKVNGWIPVKRYGFVVEINALWYNALCIMEKFSKLVKNYSINYAKEKDIVKKIFTKTFWNSEKEYLNDVIRDGHIEDILRPNQIIAISLPFSILSDEKKILVLDKTFEKLYTPLGFKTLVSDDINYEPFYEGCAVQRDGAYHRGTAWTWLLGEWIKAYIGIYGRDKWIEHVGFECIKENLREGGVGSIGEIYEASYPHIGKGCFAQAWSVGTILEAYNLFKKE